jgi:hypothetical protein
MHAIKSGNGYVFIFSGAMVTDAVTPIDCKFFKMIDKIANSSWISYFCEKGVNITA